jgi:hypothetical protein
VVVAGQRCAPAHACTLGVGGCGGGACLAEWAKGSGAARMGELGRAGWAGEEARRGGGLRAQAGLGCRSWATR